MAKANQEIKFCLSDQIVPIHQPMEWAFLVISALQKCDDLGVKEPLRRDLCKQLHIPEVEANMRRKLRIAPP